VQEAQEFMDRLLINFKYNGGSEDNKELDFHIPLLEKL
jgi:hypothetical protein